MHACGMGVIADGALLDCLRRAATFGLFLVRLDVRQDSARHAAALSEITEYRSWAATTSGTRRPAWNSFSRN
ncbi:phosphoenolpyruvate carboxylase [Pseudomonas aeruginosa]|nr:phosphoenolpyruvate carboxylase [Pseudomonas aeruginosa]